MLMVKEGEIESHDGTRDQSSFLLVFCQDEDALGACSTEWM